MAYQLTGMRYTWWRGDALPLLPPLATFHAERSSDGPLLAHLSCMGIDAIQARLATGHRPYVAFLQGQPVAYGWSATQQERIGPDLAWPLLPFDRSLWDFTTLPAWRGQGIYPRLLQTILQTEIAEAERFWIGHTTGNTASQRGIRKAGFQPTIEGVMTAAGQVQWLVHGDPARTAADPMVQHFGGLAALCPPA